MKHLCLRLSLPSSILVFILHFAFCILHLLLVAPGRRAHAWGMAERMIAEVLAKPDAALEMTLRPSLFSEFTGQENV
ncbi:MAG TPA: hypothetical protein VN765_01030, partial [Candidatus Acidoferrum sp.]|nr:hypothetical protein [Candidatus Acidoferrum sp.]